MRDPVNSDHRLGRFGRFPDSSSGNLGNFHIQDKVSPKRPNRSVNKVSILICLSFRESQKSRLSVDSREISTQTTSTTRPRSSVNAPKVDFHVIAYTFLYILH